MPSRRVSSRTGRAAQVLAAWGVVLPRLAVRRLVPRRPSDAIAEPLTSRADVPVQVNPRGWSSSQAVVGAPAREGPPRASAPLLRVVNVVAHPDDDLIFLSPDLLVALRSAEAVRTVFLTSGDGGRGRLYARAREEGVRRAYAAACGVTNCWEVHDYTCAGLPVLVDVLRRDPRVSLVFLRLPDGSPRGGGTRRGRQQSLQKLLEGDIRYLERMETAEQLTLDEVIDLVGHLLREFRPTETRTLDYSGAFAGGDHSDHVASARIVRFAQERLAGGAGLAGYLGYTTAVLPANVAETWLARKIASIRTYARCDPVFGLGYDPRWAARQYVSPRECPVLRP